MTTRPLDQQGSSFGREHRARGVLMRGRQHDRVDPGRRELRADEPLCVYPYRYRLEPSLLDRARLPAPTGVLDRHPGCALPAQRLPEGTQAVRQTTEDDDVVILCNHGPRPTEVFGDRVTQLRNS